MARGSDRRAQLLHLGGPRKEEGSLLGRWADGIPADPLRTTGLGIATTRLDLDASAELRDRRPQLVSGEAVRELLPAGLLRAAPAAAGPAAAVTTPTGYVVRGVPHPEHRPSD
ncbi:MAG: hypothetical protein V9G12_02860 [Microthrixaceae bacterium]